MESLLVARLREHRAFLLGLASSPSSSIHARAMQIAADLAIAAAVVECDYDRAPGAAIGADLATARRLGVGHVMRTLCVAIEMGGVTASKLAEMLGYSVGDLHGDGLQRVANATYEAARFEDPRGPVTP